MSKVACTKPFYHMSLSYNSSLWIKGNFNTSKWPKMGRHQFKWSFGEVVGSVINGLNIIYPYRLLHCGKRGWEQHTPEWLWEWKPDLFRGVVCVGSLLCNVRNSWVSIMIIVGGGSFSFLINFSWPRLTREKFLSDRERIFPFSIRISRTRAIR